VFFAADERELDVPPAALAFATAAAFSATTFSLAALCDKPLDIKYATLALVTLLKFISDASPRNSVYKSIFARELYWASAIAFDTG